MFHETLHLHNLIKEKWWTNSFNPTNAVIIESLSSTTQLGLKNSGMALQYNNTFTLCIPR